MMTMVLAPMSQELLLHLINGTSMAAPHVAGVLLLGTANANGYVLNDPDGVADPIVSQ